MKSVIYAKTNKTIHRIGFGAWQLNNPLWGSMSEDEGIQLVQTAIASGINFFDTAPGYGNGMSETILGIAIQGRREQVVINTKLGHLADGTSDFSVESLESQILASLKRMQITYLDSAILHNPSHDILSGKTAHFQQLNQLKQKGLIRAYGVSIDTYEELMTVLNHVKVDVIEILFNVFFQGPAQGFQLAKEKGVSLVAKVPLDSGWLTGKYNQDSIFTGIRNRWSKDVIKRRADLIEDVKQITQQNNLIGPAMGFILSFPEITAVIPGIQSLDQLKTFVEVDFTITETVKQKLITLYQQKIQSNPLPW
ncbi:aldo/keto reductase [Acholeplasma manati]|uniref:Aldo/keto reductase n=1 Tax=Paracholeplasma manati TaxID=591373 RepID=A0ABT2Y3S0_9MOLU|nr:aldo/keto reductase [Paracholeplasma manati]MCV2231382.1 aldo/keto reductase [Paracholeplasma manati]